MIELPPINRYSLDGTKATMVKSSEYEIEAPDGYKFTGEFRHARPGETYLRNNRVYRENLSTLCPVHILTRVAGAGHWWEFETGDILRTVSRTAGDRNTRLMIVRDFGAKNHKRIVFVKGVSRMVDMSEDAPGDILWGNTMFEKCGHISEFLENCP